MKSIMKSAFAIIAVALMIMVAVVPMVSVFTEENGVDAAVAAKEYDNSVADPIIISGKLLQADGTTAIANSIVYATISTGTGAGTYATISTGTGAGTYVGYTNASGEFSISITQETGTALGDIVLSVEDGEIIMNAAGAYIYNGAYGLSFPSVTLKNVTGDESVNIIAGSVLVTGKLALKGSDTGVNAYDIVISGAEGTVKTAADGTFSFYGIVGNEYTMTASAVGTTFAYKATTDGKYTVKASGNSDIVLKAADYLLYGTTTVPAFTFSAMSTPATGTVASVTELASPTFTTLADGSYYYYAKITYNTDASTSAFSATTFDVNFVANSGIASQKTNTLPALTRGTTVTGQADCNISVSPSNLISGSVAVGDATYSVPLVSTTQFSAVTLTGTYVDGSTTTSVTRTAVLSGGKWFVGTEYTYTPSGGSATTVALTVTKIVPTVSVTGYTFTPVTSSGVIYSNNHVLVSGEVSYFEGMTANVVYTATTGTALPASPAVLTKAIGSAAAVNTYKFYVPAGTSVTVNAPSATNGTYTPNVFTNVNVQSAITVPEFKYVANSYTYKGTITLNGTPVAPDVTEKMFAVSYDNGITFVPVAFTLDTDGVTYVIKSAYAITDIKVSQLYDGGYTFATSKLSPATSGAGYYYNITDITTAGSGPTIISAIAVKTTTAYVKITNFAIDDEKAVALSGITVKFYQSSSSSSIGTEIASASVTTDASGVAQATIAKPLAKSELKTGDYRIYAVVTSTDHTFSPTIGTNAAYLVTTFGSSIAAEDVPITAMADAVNIYGYLKTDSGIIGNVDYTYDIFVGSDKKYFESSAGKTVDGKYSLYCPDDAKEIKLYISGYGSDATGAPVTIDVAIVGQQDKTVVVVPASVTNYKVSTSGLYSDKINVATGNSYVKGDVITFSAISEYKVEDSKNQYTDGYTKYTFKAWYVNGKQVSTDAVTSYTIGDESIVVSADYTVEHVTTGEVKVEEKQGVDSTVLVIGIAAVVIALIAVIYAVIQRKN